MSPLQFYWFEKLFVALPILIAVLLVLVLYRVMGKPQRAAKSVEAGQVEPEGSWPPPPNRSEA